MGSIWEESYFALDKAIKSADKIWKNMTDYDKHTSALYIIKADDPDDVEGEIIKTYEV